MSTWTEQLTAQAAPAAVLDVLTDPDACGRWAPVPFDVDDDRRARLRAGSRTRVEGRLAGRRVGFDVEVLAADEERLALRARGMGGSVSLDVEYRLRAVPAGSEVRASIAVRGDGLTGRVLAQATGALLGAGALRTAMARIAREAEELAFAAAA
jgi:uncharacterized protein YndB with AHSA1/START domain